MKILLIISLSLNAIILLSFIYFTIQDKKNRKEMIIHGYPGSGKQYYGISNYNDKEQEEETCHTK